MNTAKRRKTAGGRCEDHDETQDDEHYLVFHFSSLFYLLKFVLSIIYTSRREFNLKAPISAISSSLE